MPQPLGDTMLSINNAALPSAGSLVISLLAPKGAETLSLMQVRALWPGLGTAQVQQILTDTAQSFTLGCLDPRTGTIRGITAKLTKCEARAVPASGLYALDLLMEEIV